MLEACLAPFSAICPLAWISRQIFGHLYTSPRCSANVLSQNPCVHASAQSLVSVSPYYLLVAVAHLRVFSPVFRVRGWGWGLGGLVEPET